MTEMGSQTDWANFACQGTPERQLAAVRYPEPVLPDTAPLQPGRCSSRLAIGNYAGAPSRDIGPNDSPEVQLVREWTFEIEKFTAHPSRFAAPVPGLLVGCFHQPLADRATGMPVMRSL